MIFDDWQTHKKISFRIGGSYRLAYNSMYICYINAQIWCECHHSSKDAWSHRNFASDEIR